MSNTENESVTLNLSGDEAEELYAKLLTLVEDGFVADNDENLENVIDKLRSQL